MNLKAQRWGHKYLIPSFCLPSCACNRPSWQRCATLKSWRLAMNRTAEKLRAEKLGLDFSARNLSAGKTGSWPGCAMPESWLPMNLGAPAPLPALDAPKLAGKGAGAPRVNGRNARPKLEVQAPHEVRSAGFRTWSIAGFQIGGPAEVMRPPGLETGDTADLEVCATPSRLLQGFNARRFDSEKSLPARNERGESRREGRSSKARLLPMDPREHSTFNIRQPTTSLTRILGCSKLNVEG